MAWYSYNLRRARNHTPIRSPRFHGAVQTGSGVFPAGDCVLKNDAAIFPCSSWCGVFGGGGGRENRGIHAKRRKSAARTYHYVGCGGIAPAARSGNGAGTRERSESGVSRRSNRAVRNRN